MSGPATHVTHLAQHTGRLVVVLNQKVVDWINHQPPAAGAPEFKDLNAFDGPGSVQLRQVLQRYGARTMRAFRSLSTAEINALESAARDGPYRPANSLLAYWIIEPGPAISGASAASLAGLLGSMTDVFESVHLEEAVGPPPVNWQNDKYAKQQFHLDPAPTGIDAKFAWTVNADGSGIGFADVEMGWNLSHQDLKAKLRTRLLCHQNDPTNADHGTGVLGLVVGRDNSKGVVGIAPGVTSVRLASHWDGTSAANVADAVATAAHHLAVGDVLLLETQSSSHGPIELLAGGAEMTAIQTASSKGVIVIEAAGNAGRNLDPNFPKSRPDSGAIMVGASVGEAPPANMNAKSHERLGSSNYGDRVDCFAPGICLVTAGGGDLDQGGGNANRAYTAAFHDTSGASAVIAGAAILAQHMHVLANNARLDAAGMRAVLTQNGRKQSAQDGNIGIMPDLRRIGNGLNVEPELVAENEPA